MKTFNQLPSLEAAGGQNQLDEHVFQSFLGIFLLAAAWRDINMWELLGLFMWIKTTYMLIYENHRKHLID